MTSTSFNSLTRRRVSRHLVEDLQGLSVQIRMPEGICMLFAARAGHKSGGPPRTMLPVSACELWQWWVRRPPVTTGSRPDRGECCCRMEKTMNRRPSAIRSGPYVVERQITLQPATAERWGQPQYWR